MRFDRVLAFDAICRLVMSQCRRSTAHSRLSFVCVFIRNFLHGFLLGFLLGGIADQARRRPFVVCEDGLDLTFLHRVLSNEGRWQATKHGCVGVFPLEATKVRQNSVIFRKKKVLTLSYNDQIRTLQSFSSIRGMVRLDQVERKVCCLGKGNPVRHIFLGSRMDAGVL